MPDSPPAPANHSEAVLLHLHQFASKEITRYRDLEWKIPSIQLTFLLGLATAMGSDGIARVVSTSMPLRVLLSLLTLSLFSLVVTFLRFTQTNMKKQYRFLALIEGELTVVPLVEKAGIKPTGRMRGWRERLKRLINLVLLEMIGAGIAMATALWFIWAK